MRANTQGLVERDTKCHVCKFSPSVRRCNVVVMRGPLTKFAAKPHRRNLRSSNMDIPLCCNVAAARVTISLASPNLAWDRDKQVIVTPPNRHQKHPRHPFSFPCLPISRRNSICGCNRGKQQFVSRHVFFCCCFVKVSFCLGIFSESRQSDGKSVLPP